MSGGVGPTCGDIGLPEEQEQEHKQSNDFLLSAKKIKDSDHPNAPKKTAFLSFRQLNALAVILVFSASGMVCPQDLAFVLFSFVYMYFISAFAFPSLHSSSESAIFSPQNKLLPLYVFTGVIIGLFLPIAYILEGVFEGDKRGIKAAAPHVFLLGSQVCGFIIFANSVVFLDLNLLTFAAQIFMEGVAFSDRFSIPIRVFVPVFYNSRRIFTIFDWLKDEFSKIDQEDGGSERRLYVGKGLAMANMAFWSFNLFGFLLPFYLPKAFQRYYSVSKLKDGRLIRVLKD